MLNIEPFDVMPRATEHIKEQIDMVKKLEEKWYTYKTSDGIYMDTSKVPDYWKLARLDTEKLKCAIYECGPLPNKQPNKISAQFYLMALLFILFDVEIIFMFPWAVDFRILGMFGFVEMILFIVLLAIGFVYAWKKGALQWHSIK